MITIQNLVRQESVPSQKDYWKKIIRYGDYDNFPLRLANLVRNSPTASSCLDTKADFIEGSGFSDDKLADIVINSRKERFGDIHHENSKTYSIFEGFALNIKYNRKFEISEIFTVPFEYCRFAIPDSKGVINKIQVNPYFGTEEFRTEYTKEYDVYDPDPKAVAAQMSRDQTKYKGQILYVAGTSPLSRFYPTPSYYSCDNWMDIDNAIGVFHKNNIDKGFFQSIMLSLIGRENDPSTHPEDQILDKDSGLMVPNPNMTNGMRFNIEFQKLGGAASVGSFIALWAEMAEGRPQIQPFPANTNSELYKTIADLTTENISRGTQTPSILANISSGASLGGDGNQIRASVKLMQQRVLKTQNLFARIYSELLSHMATPYTQPVKILNYNPFPEAEKIDPLIWAALTVDEQRNWIKDNTEYTLLGDAPPPTPAPVNKFANVFYANYPDKAKQTAQKALKFRVDNHSNCGGKQGWALSQDIIDGKPLSFKNIKRIFKYLKDKKSVSNQMFSESCESLLYSAWGGEAMLNWAEGITSSVNE